MLKALFQSNDRKLRQRLLFGKKDYISYRKEQYIIDPNAIYRSGFFNTPTIMYIEGYSEPCNFFNPEDLPRDKKMFNTDNVSLILKKLFRFNNFEEIMIILMVVLVIAMIVIGIAVFNLSDTVQEVIPYVPQS